ncbi:MAG: hypothetical protein JOY61_12095, partial [Chloroflexi bacterium]|nr:hypothetical protein [Chloroflexota bacterium]
LANVPLGRAAGLPHGTALWWLGLAERVDPSDWRPYAMAASMLKYEQPRRAHTLLSQALSLRGADSARSVITGRLQDPAAPLPADVHATHSALDSELFVEASEQLQAQPDLDGAMYAARLAAEADAANAEACARARELRVSVACPS